MVYIYNNQLYALCIYSAWSGGRGERKEGRGKREEWRRVRESEGEEWGDL